MESFEGEAHKCIDLAIQSAKYAGNRERALNFLLQAEILYSTGRARQLLAKLQRNYFGLDQSTNTGIDQNTRFVKRDTVIVRNPNCVQSIEYTSEQWNQIQRIEQCEDYYSIFNVPEDATVSAIRTAYKKLTLLVHPDKNKAPGAKEAFIAIGKAFNILIDLEKRKQYDCNRSSCKNFYQTNMDGYKPYSRDEQAPSKRAQMAQKYSWRVQEHVNMIHDHARLLKEHVLIVKEQLRMAEEQNQRIQEQLQISVIQFLRKILSNF